MGMIINPLGSVSGGGASPSSTATKLLSPWIVADYNAAISSRINGGVTLNNGDPVSSWAEPSGLYTGTQSGSNRPIYRASLWSDGGPCIEFTGASAHYLNVPATLATKVSDNSRGYTVAALVRRTVASADQAILSFCGSNSSNSRPLHQVPYLSSANQGASWIATAAANAKFINGGSVNLTEDVFIVAVVRGTTSEVWVNGQRTTGDMAQTSDTSFNAVAIGTALVAGSPANNLSARMRRLTVFGRALAPREIMALTYSLGVQGLTRHKIVADGNSLTIGQGGTPYPSQLVVPASTLSVVNLGVGGQTSQAMMTTFMANVAPVAADPYLPIIYIGWELTNRIYFGSDAATAVADMNTLGDMAAALGPHVRRVVLSGIARGNFTSQAAMSATLVQANNLLRAGAWKGHFDTFVDVGARPDFLDTSYNTGSPAFNNATIYNGDLVHLTSAGYLEIAQAINVSAEIAALQKEAAVYWLRA